MQISRATIRALALCFAALGSIPASAAAEPLWSPPAFTALDSLFITAATGEPRFQAVREAAEKALLADPATLDYLIEHRLRDQTPRQQQYVERLFTVMSDSGRNPRPRETLAAATATTSSDTVLVQLLYIGSRIGDLEFRRVALPWLRSSYEPVRRMAIRSLGAYPRAENLPPLWDGLETVNGLELHQRLWALDAHAALLKKGDEWKQLAPLLKDSLFFNRRRTHDMLLKATDSSWSKLRAAMPKSVDGIECREWRLLAQEAKGGRVFLEKEKKKMTTEEKAFFGL